MPKAIATYDAHPDDFIKVGYRASVFCKTHARNELCNRLVLTSTVQSIDGAGIFETLNTLYIPATE